MFVTFVLVRKLTNDKVTSTVNDLFSMKQVADQNNDPQMADFIESEFLEEQVNCTLSVCVCVCS